MVMDGNGGGFGVYVHIPFCVHRCSYCDFATWTDRAHLTGAYVDACIADLERRAPAMPAATSVYFGGGTPSLLPAEGIAAILDAIRRAPGAEVTVECNPESVDRARFKAYAAAGVNRVSMGAQSFVPHVLRALDRVHDPASVGRAVAGARAAGIERVNLDLIYGTPGETLADWHRSLDAVLALGVEHVSAYALTIEAGTPLGRAVAAGERAAPDDDDQADKYALADDVLEAHGLAWYEVSNWATPGQECRHNLLYWSMGEYAGVGCAAHGHTAGTRWWNVRTPERYLERIASGASPVAGEERLDPRPRAEEAFALALRTRAGALLTADAPAVAELTGAGLLEARDGRVVLTRRGRLLANEVTARLLLAETVVGTRYD
jgi:oxygen-independent coproporphyrinogen-3 oxidase